MPWADSLLEWSDLPLPVPVASARRSLIMAIAPRIALIHALTHSPPPINQAFAELWPQARLMNLLDDSLSADLAANPRGLDVHMTERFLALAAYAVASGADAILFTCSAFGPCIDAVKARYPQMPVYKPNEAMIEEALGRLAAASPGDARLGLVASFAPTLRSMPAEFPPGTSLFCELAEGALEALNRGDTDAHDRLTAEAALRLKRQGCSLIALAQFSLARAQPLTAATVEVPVLTTVASAVQALQRRFQH